MEGDGGGELNHLTDGDVESDLDIWLEDRNEIIEIEGSAVKVHHQRAGQTFEAAMLCQTGERSTRTAC